jgi:peptidoglycan/LPS O-acetylase OafA/YrhL
MDEEKGVPHGGNADGGACMKDPLAERIYGVPWLLLALVAAAIAVSYAFVPLAAGETGVRWFVLRWFHTIAWIFLGLSALVRSKVTGIPVEGAAPLGATGGLIYVVLMLMTVAG